MRSAVHWPFAAVLLLGAAHIAPVWAGQMRPDAARLSELLNVADTVVLTRCDPGTSTWTGDPPIIVTEHRCHVSRVFKGQPADSISIHVLGGQVGDVGMAASAGGDVSAAAEMVLLLQHSRFGAYYVITGGASGAIRVSGSPENPTAAGMPLDDFARLVKP